MEEKDYALQQKRCPGRTFLLIRENDDRLIGTINVRRDLNEAMLRFGGHIGYGIRPSERGKGYARVMLYMGLREALGLGLSSVMIGCSASNIPSDRTIRALGGVLERSGTDPEDGEVSNVYWIDTEKALHDHRDTYEPFISEKHSFP
jgi:predicted acetyltransferase